MSATPGFRPTDPDPAATSAAAPPAPGAAGHHAGDAPSAGPFDGTPPDGPDAAAPVAATTAAGPGSDGARLRREATAGLALLALLLALAVLVRTSAVTRLDLRIDRRVQPLRTAGATDVFHWLTNASAEAVGVAALVVGLVVLVVRGRRLAAARLLVTAGAAWSLALVLKTAVDRPRPPASLWVQPPDNSGSFPSGHDTTATLLLVIVVSALVGTGTLRRVGAVLAVVFALAVGFGRVYLGDHYPTDILGSYLTVAAVVLLVLALTDLAPVRRRLDSVGLHDEWTPMSWRGRNSDSACPCPAAHETPRTESVPASVRPHGHPRGTASTTGRADTPPSGPLPDRPDPRPAAAPRQPR